MIEARNEADTLAYSVEKSLQEYKVRAAAHEEPQCIVKAACVQLSCLPG
jgi:hypothetical protein